MLIFYVFISIPNREFLEFAILGLYFENDKKNA